MVYPPGIMKTFQLTVAVLAILANSLQVMATANEERIGPEVGPSGFSVFHACPENPSATLIAYNTWDTELQKRATEHGKTYGFVTTTAATTGSFASTLCKETTITAAPSFG